MTVSYAAPSPGVTTPGGGAAPQTAVEGAGNFLTALIDQLLAGAAPAPTAAAPADFGLAATDVAATAPPVPVGTSAGTPPTAESLLAKLADALADLEETLKSGGKPDADQLKALDEAVSAIASALGIAPPQIAVPTAGEADPLAVAPSIPVGAEIAATSAGDRALPALGQLADRLAQVGQLAAADAPELADKLATLSAKLETAQTSTDLTAKLAALADTDGTQLDALIRSLLDQRGAPQAALAALGIKTPNQAEATPQPSVVSAAVAISADPATAALKLTAVVKSATGETAKPDAPVEVKVAAADQPDAPQPTSAVTAPAQHTPASRAAQAAYQPVSAQASALPQLAFEMVRQFQNGQSRFTVRLDPPELGRVDVKMHVDATGNVTARLTVERAETLDMFQRDQRVLERALVQAGLDGNKTNLEFSLKQQSFSMPQQQGQHGQNGGYPGASGRGGDDADAAPVPVVNLYRGTISAGGVNLFV
ncbi:MAG: flagellar hook-length control protein FliK [Devosia sp.]